jgi:hypothetical protein
VNLRQLSGSFYREKQSLQSGLKQDLKPITEVPFFMFPSTLYSEVMCQERCNRRFGYNSGN